MIFGARCIYCEHEFDDCLDWHKEVVGAAYTRYWFRCRFCGAQSRVFQGSLENAKQYMIDIWTRYMRGPK